MENQYLKVSEICKLFNLNKQTVHKFIKRKELKAIKLDGIYIINKQDLKEFIDNHMA